MNEWFRRLAEKTTWALGTWQALILSVVLVLAWAVTGPFFNFSDTWQLFINTVTTVVTFWMVFVIQNSSNRDARAVHIKLDTIIAALDKAQNTTIAAEKETDERLDEIEEELRVAVEAEDSSG